MQIDFCKQESYIGSINIEDYGNCAIEANNDEGQYWYLIVDTCMGFVRTMEYGPIVPSLSRMEDSCVCVFSRSEFDGKKVVKKISDFLNKTRKGYMDITQAREVSRKTALSQCRSIIEYMKDPEEF